MTSTPHSTRLGNVWWPVIVGLVTAVLCLPFLRIIYWLGDEGVLLHGAERMLRGSTLYTDFFAFLPPGGYLITAGWLHLFGISMVSARTLAILTIVGITFFTYLACLRASNSAITSAFIVLGWVVMSQGIWTQVNHHWFTTLFSMVAAWAALASPEKAQRLTRWSVVAGLASGAAVMITPTRGALGMLAAAVAFTNSWRNAGGFLLGSAVLPVGIVSYVIASGALSPAFEDVIELSAKRYADIQGVPFGFGANNKTFLLKHLFPVAGLLTILACAQAGLRSLRQGPLKVCIVFGLAGFVGCFPRPDVDHIAFAAPLVCPLLAFCLQPFRRILPGGRYAAVTIALLLCLPALREYSSVARGAFRGERVTTPRGTVTFPSGYGDRELLARIAATPTADAYLFYPYMPMLPFLTAREHVSKHDVFVPGYTSPSEYDEACASAMQRASWVVINRNWTDPAFLRSVFPALVDPRRPETVRFETALEHGFEFVAREGAFELRRRSGSTNELCGSSTQREPEHTSR